jgi:hypothetical protein
MRDRGNDDDRDREKEKGAKRRSHRDLYQVVMKM